MPASVLKLKPDTHASLRQISSEDGTPMSEIVAMLVSRYERERFWRGVQEDLDRLQKDPAAWQEYQNELQLWDRATVADGLTDEDPYYTEDESL